MTISFEATSSTSEVDLHLARNEQQTAFLSGIQAIVRMIVEQIRRDRTAGLRIGAFITGYPGSPLGGMENTLRSLRPVLDKYDIRHVPAQNEELAASSLMGTQMIDEHPHPDYDGVIGFWYGKGPGVDRSSDAMKHGNFAGTSRNGAVVVLSGEDHEAKSSSVPYQQEYAFEHYGMPVLYPATVREIVEFGLHAIAVSRFSGCWIALKLTAPICDGGATVFVPDAVPEIKIPDVQIDGKPFSTTANFRFYPGLNLATERNLYYDRHTAVKAYARENRLDRIVVRSPRDRIGIVAAGKTYTETLQALIELGLTEGKLSALGIRVLKIGMISPLEPQIVKEFGVDLDEVIVVEEKRDFLERQIGRIFCDLSKPPKLIGKLNYDGTPLFPIDGGFDQDFIAKTLGALLSSRLELPAAGLSRLDEIESIEHRPVPQNPSRTPGYCSGCPHNVGTKTAPGQIAWGAPGCHVFAAIMPEPRRIEAVTQYGGDGLPWIGLSPFTSRKHILVNMGDGSLFHSSYLNIRYAIAVGAAMTFKILYNGAVANTGGQLPVGQRSVPQLISLLLTEGVARIILIAKDPSLYKKRDIPSPVEIRDPAEIEAAQLELEATPGVTVLIFDGQCANERRRLQKRGRLPKPTRFTVVNEDVCENCGHCGTQSNCMSLRKTQTEFGEKTVIHQSSCNQDMTCLTAECPSFVTVQTEEGRGVRRPKVAIPEDDIPNPNLPGIDTPYQICTPGVGGTGVITVNAILAQATTLDGNRALTFDQTGSAQKWGPVLSSLIVAKRDDPIAVNNIGLGQTNLYLALDLLASVDRKNLIRCNPRSTVAVINSSPLPTVEMVRDVNFHLFSKPMIDAIGEVSNRSRNIAFDATGLAERIFGNYMMTNMIVVGAAFQAGLLPISARAIEQAIRLNNTDVSGNIAAFRIGRLAVQKPEKLDVIARGGKQFLANRIEELQRRTSAKRVGAREQLLRLVGGIDDETSRLLKIRIDDLFDYQGKSYARKFVFFVREVLVAEDRLSVAGQQHRLTRAVIKNLYKLIAYKDEYEVARLLIQKVFRENTKAMFEGPVKLRFHLQPPIIRHFGLKRKVAIGDWGVPVLALLSKLKFLRGTIFDMFGYAPIRREERKLIDWYIDLLKKTMDSLRPDNLEVALTIANLPEDIRGYEAIKAANISKTQARALALVEALNAPKVEQLSA